jgi:hypothetical protein
MRRLHLVELEDLPWFPRVIRDLATDYLQFVAEWLHFDRAMAPLVCRVLEHVETRRVVDLCSGGSGPLPGLVRELAAQGVDVRATLTDLYPNIPAFEQIAAASNGRIDFERRSIDARAVPDRLPGLRTIFNGFHHLRPEDARAVLHAAAAARQPIAMFEISERSIRMLPVVLTPLMVLVATPFMRPFLWRRLLWTYLIPLVPLTCLWDGIVSQLRAYSVDELRGLSAGSAPMHWEIGHLPIASGVARLTYVLGTPTVP